MIEVGAVIRAARKQRKLSQEQLSRPLGMGRSTISGIETGKINEIGMRKVMALCTSLGLEIYVGEPRGKVNGE